MSTFDKTVESLNTVIKNLDAKPYCTGTFPWDVTKSTLFYTSSKGGSRFLNFPAADSQLESLFSACQPATFGLDGNDVLEVGQIDVGHFATTFSPFDDGLVAMLAETLLHDRFEIKDIKVELNKLNVYGPGGFVKAHVDTHRDASMFGSLVVMLPTIHEGGSLILRHDGKEWTFRSSEAVSTTPAQAAFIASFSDVEHEVKTVSSGFQVTLTYNLHPRKASAVICKQVEDDMEVKEALARLLKDPTSFPDGGFIGFGLSHGYPFDADKTVSDIIKRLRGSDAIIKRACDHLSLPVSIKAVYDDDESRAVLLDNIVNIEYHIDEPLLCHLEGGDGQSVQDYQEGENWELDYDPIVWFRRLSGTNEFKSTYLTEHHKWPLAYAHGEVCMIATVPSTEERVK